MLYTCPPAHPGAVLTWLLTWGSSGPLGRDIRSSRLCLCPSRLPELPAWRRGQCTSAEGRASRDRGGRTARTEVWVQGLLRSHGVLQDVGDLTYLRVNPQCWVVCLCLLRCPIYCASLLAVEGPGATSESPDFCVEALIKRSMNSRHPRALTLVSGAPDCLALRSLA